MPAVGDQHRGGQACTITMPSNGTGAIFANPFEEPLRRMNEYTAREIATLQARLDKKLGPEYISSRPGASGQRVHYLSADKCINLANEVFGFNGWSSSIQNIQIDFVEESQHTGKISLGLSVIVRVTLKDGTYHEDIGYGHIENCKGKAAAFEKAKKEGTTDALKRALRNFGNVLGNCIYDKDYVSKVTKVKAAPAKWDVKDLHRHPDYVPIKKEPPQQKPASEDDDLPPPRVNLGSKNESVDDSAAFDGDGEFGSDLFDEADFVVSATGNPDEIVLDSESLKKQPPVPTHGRIVQQRTQADISRPPGRPNPAFTTPSKPDRSWAPSPAPKPQNQIAHNVASCLNGRYNPSLGQDRLAGQRNFASGPTAQPNVQNVRMGSSLQQRPNQETNAIGGGQIPMKREPDPNVMDNETGSNDSSDNILGGSQSADNQRLPGTPATFFSARAVDMIQDNPTIAPTAAPQFDPHAESPSIRKTAGFDHSKSLPITKPMLASASSATNQTRDFINPSADMHRKIGAPGGSGIGSPLNRGQTTSSYRPLTRPNVDPRNMNAPNKGGVSLGPQINNTNNNGKRPPLSDVTNANNNAGGNGNGFTSGAGIGDPKRQRVNNNDGTLNGLPQQS